MSRALAGACQGLVLLLYDWKRYFQPDDMNQRHHSESRPITIDRQREIQRRTAEVGEFRLSNIEELATGEIDAKRLERPTIKMLAHVIGAHGAVLLQRPLGVLSSGSSSIPTMSR